MCGHVQSCTRVWYYFIFYFSPNRLKKNSGVSIPLFLSVAFCLGHRLSLSLSITHSHTHTPTLSLSIVLRRSLSLSRSLSCFLNRYKVSCIAIITKVVSFNYHLVLADINFEECNVLFRMGLAQYSKTMVYSGLYGHCTVLFTYRCIEFDSSTNLQCEIFL